MGTSVLPKSLANRVSGPGAISRVPSVKFTFNLFSQIFMGAK